MNTPLFVLTSDLGTGSPAVAQIKAVLLAALPEARIQDLTHEVPPMSIRDAELALRSTAFMYPAGTVHVVVVDPGVGTDRKILAVRARDRFFVGPDNGVLGVAVREPDAGVVSVDKPELWRHPVSNTLHGRDIFAPVAARLADHTALHEVGTPLEDPLPSGIPEVEVRDERTVVGQTLGRDRFGNLFTNIPEVVAGKTLGESWHYEIDGQMIPYRSTYMAAKIGRMIVTTGADRFLEVAVTQGSAADKLGRADGVEIFCVNKRG